LQFFSKSLRPSLKDNVRSSWGFIAMGRHAIRRFGALLLSVTCAIGLGGCVVGTVAGAAVGVAATGVKAGASVAGAAVHVTADGVSAAGKAVTGAGKPPAS
jgi:hypothetical protein